METYKEIGKILKSNLNVLLKSDLNCMILFSKQGIGKTTFVFKEMKQRNFIENEHFHYFNSYFTPLSFYKALERSNELNKPKLLILDDVEAILKNVNIVNMLKSATWGNELHKRVVNYNTTSSKVENQSLDYNGKVIILINQIPENNPVFNAIIDRSLFCKLQFNNQQLLSFMKNDIIKKEYIGIPFHKRKIIFEFIQNNTTNKTNLSLRTLIKAYNAYKFASHNWKDLVMLSLKEDNNNNNNL